MRRKGNENKIILRCLHSRCPRTRLIERDNSIPNNVVEIKSYCPWHEPSGCKDLPEFYYDKNGKNMNIEVCEFIQKGTIQ